MVQPADGSDGNPGKEANAGTEQDAGSIALEQVRSVVGLDDEKSFLMHYRCECGRGRVLC